MRSIRSLFVPLLALIITLGASAVITAPEGQMTWAVDVSQASAWLDPAETSWIVTPWMVLYALHDAMVKPCPQAHGAKPGQVMERDVWVYWSRTTAALR